MPCSMTFALTSAALGCDRNGKNAYKQASKNKNKQKYNKTNHLAVSSLLSYSFSISIYIHIIIRQKVVGVRGVTHLLASR